MRRREQFIEGIFPIQIRPDLVVRIAPIPHDLTPAEADKIARVVKALAVPVIEGGKADAA